MSRMILIGVLALALLLAGASAVLAQDAPSYGHRMLQAPATTGPDAAPAEPGSEQQGAVCPMAASMGNAGMMNSPEMQDAREQMQNGNWEAMRDACQKAWEKNQGTSAQA